MLGMQKAPLLFYLSVYLATEAHAASILPFPIPEIPPIGRCFRLALPFWKHWALPSEVRACMSGFPFKEDTRKNILDVITKTLAFHASTNYQVQAPSPFDNDVKWDLLDDLKKINDAPSYPTDLDFHIAVQKSLKKVNDGHLMYNNYCYDGVYMTYNPFPLVLLTNPIDESQAVYISPYAHQIVESAFGKDAKFWADFLGKPLKEFSGARVIKINGEDPFTAVNNNAETTGSFQGLSSRQNSFFSTAVLGSNGWSYRLGDFAQQDLPMVDFVELTIQRAGFNSVETITVPYRSKFNRKHTFLNRKVYEYFYCKPTKTTNGRDWYSKGFVKGSQDWRRSVQQGVGIRSTEAPLPDALRPSLKALQASSETTQFYILEDSTTGVLVLRNFDGKEGSELSCTLFKGLKEMRERKVENLIIDLTDNSGGSICAAHFLHRLLLGKNTKTSPQPGLDTVIRMPEVAQKIVKNMPGIDDRFNGILYNRAWRDANHQSVENGEWFKRVRNITINGRPDFFSPRLGMECDLSPKFCSATESLGNDPLFEAEKITLLSDGRCGSSCAIFSVLLAKKHGVRTVVVGGKSDVKQQYCGFVGGETVSFQEIDTTLKIVKLKGRENDSPDVPPDMDVNGALSITWRLAYGVDNPDEPEEWQDHTANMGFPLTADMAHKPQKIWEAVAKNIYPVTTARLPTALQVQLP